MSSKRSFKGVKSKWMAQYKKKSSFKKKPRVARIKGAIPPRKELKFVDTTIATGLVTYVPGASVITLLNGIAEGDDYSARDGRQATMKSVAVRLTINQQQTGASGGLTRTMLVWDNAANGAAPVAADILAVDSAASYPNVNNAQRFTILRDHLCEIGPLSLVATQTYSRSPGSQHVDLYVPLDHITQFMGTGATIASIQNGALFLLTVSDGTVALNNSVIRARVRFSDD